MSEREIRNGGVRRKFWYVGDLIAFGMLSIYILYVHSYCEVSYRSGLQHNGAPRFATGISIGLLFPFAAILLLILVFRLSFTWSKRIADRKRRWKLRGLAIAALAFYGLVFFASFRSSGDKFTLGLQEYAQAHVDVPTIQTWLRTVNPEDCLGDMLRVHIESLPKAEQAQWPEAIQSLKPRQVSLHLDANHRPVVRLAWGGWDEEYGVVIARIDTKVFNTPAAQEETTDPNTFYQHAHYMRPLAPGACVYYAF